ncbi:hypothetical protein [Isoalcanivorax indicus]|uniref:hypothetical protein n=1 Tax=Isoalcanivorax indicus TaxID=2202653 RepID=UPI0013C497A6|nr:hypothetical protein [Isoalcanivorax indicus]
MLMSRPVYVFVLMLGMALLLALATASHRHAPVADTVGSCHKRGHTVGHTVAMSGFDLVGLRPCIAEDIGHAGSEAARPLPTHLSLEFYD